MNSKWRPPAHQVPTRLRFEDGAPFQIDLRPTIEAIVGDMANVPPTGEISARFHLTMARVIAASCDRIRNSHGLNRVCLSGGTFQNLRLLGHTVTLLRERGFEVFTHHRVPTNDGGLALGQAVIAGYMLRSSPAPGGEPSNNPDSGGPGSASSASTSP